MQVVVADLLVGERLESLGDFDPVVIDRLDCKVPFGVGLYLVGVKSERELAVVGLDLLLVGRLRTLVTVFPVNLCANIPARHREHHKDPISWEQSAR